MATKKGSASQNPRSETEQQRRERIDSARLKGWSDAPDDPDASATPEAVREIKRELAAYTKAAKWRSRTGPQEDATVLWDAVERLQLQLQEAVQ